MDWNTPAIDFKNQELKYLEIGMVQMDAGITDFVENKLK
jgi:hypothetical protein